MTLPKGFRLTNVEFVWGKSSFQLSPYFMPRNLKIRLDPEIQSGVGSILWMCVLTDSVILEIGM